MAKKIIIAGVAGFIGSNIYHELKKDYDVIGVDNLQFGYVENIGEELIVMDIEELSESVLPGYDVLISSYCSNIIYSIDYPVETYDNNVIKGIELYSKFKGKIINLSTSSVYGNSETLPTEENALIKLYSPYSVSKYIIEQFLRKRGNFTTLRLSNVYGPNHRPENPYCGVINKFINNKVKQVKSSITGGIGSSRDYTYVSDVVRAVKKSIALPSLNKEINIGTSIETTLYELTQMIGGDYDIDQPREIDNISRRCLDINLAKKLLGWEPKVSLKEGLELTENWIKENYYETK